MNKEITQKNKIRHIFLNKSKNHCIKYSEYTYVIRTVTYTNQEEYMKTWIAKWIDG